MSDLYESSEAGRKAPRPVHDPLCPHTTHPFPATCETCDLIADALAGLRPKVTDLPSRVELDEVGNEVTWVRYTDVLALLEEKP